MESLGGTGLGSAGLGSAGLGSAGLGSAGLGSAGLGSAGRSTRVTGIALLSVPSLTRPRRSIVERIVARTFIRHEARVEVPGMYSLRHEPGRRETRALR